MNHDQPQARIGYRDSPVSRAKSVASKVVVAVGAAVMLASAFVLSLAFLAVGLAVVVVAGGYLWWQTRDMRKQLRARMQAHAYSQPPGQIIEGEVIEPKRRR